MINKLINNNLLLLIILSSVWGSAFFAIKISVETINPISVASLRLTIAALILILYFFIRGYRFNLSLKIYIHIFFIALFGNFLPFFLISWAEIYIDSNMAALLLSIAPIFAVIFSHFLTIDDKFNNLKVVATILGFLGTCILIGKDNIFNIFNGNIYLVLPKLAVILAAFGYVISSIFAYNLKKVEITSLTTMVLIFSSLMSLPFMIYYEYFNFSQPSTKSIIAILYLGIVPTAFAFLLRFYIIAKAGPVFLSYVAYLIPLFAILWGILILNENIEPASILAIILIFIGIYYGNKGTNVKSMKKDHI